MERMTQSHLFTNTIMHNFRHEIHSILGTMSIMNMDELTRYFLPDSLDTPENRTRVWKYFFANIPNLAICQAVEDTYLPSVLKRGLNNENYDFAFIFSHIKEDSHEETDLEKLCDAKMKYLVSFIIVERNECKKYGNAYALNYICSKLKGIGSILVGLYLYSIFSHPRIDKTKLIVKKIEPPTSDEYYGPEILHMGLLELSGGYQNVPALCLYSKFGFIEDDKLSGSSSNCFRNDVNIAMRTDYPEEMEPEEIKQKIVHILLGRESEFEKPIICKFKDPEMQGYLSWLYGSKKAARQDYNKLEPQYKWEINQTEEFKEKLDLVVRKIKIIDEKIEDVRHLPGETTYQSYKSTARGKSITRRKNKKSNSKKSNSKKTIGKKKIKKSNKSKKSYKKHKKI